MTQPASCAASSGGSTALLERQPDAAVAVAQAIARAIAARIAWALVESGRAVTCRVIRTIAREVSHAIARLAPRRTMQREAFDMNLARALRRSTFLCLAHVG